MTCVVGLVVGGAVYMGSDSMSVAGWETTRATTPKVARVGPYLIGSAGSWRLINLLHHAFDPPAPPRTAKALRHFIPIRFVDSLRKCLKDGGWLHVENAQQTAKETAILVGVHGRLFLVGADLCAIEFHEGYAAEGSGSHVALGSLHTTGQLGTIHPKARVRLALQAAAAHDMGVQGPVKILEI